MVRETCIRGITSKPAPTPGTTVQVTVGLIAPTVALASSVNPVLMKAAVTFTATVSSSSGTPTGSVSFYDGTTLLGSATLAQGVATYTTSTLAAGAHSITAVYAGDSNFSSLTSSAHTETLNDFSLSVCNQQHYVGDRLAGGNG